MSLAICIFLPFRRLVAPNVPKVTVHHLTHGQSIDASLACVSNLSSTVLHSPAAAVVTELQGLNFSYHHVFGWNSVLQLEVGWSDPPESLNHMIAIQQMQSNFAEFI